MRNSKVKNSQQVFWDYTNKLLKIVMAIGSIWLVYKAIRAFLLGNTELNLDNDVIRRHDNNTGLVDTILSSSHVNRRMLSDSFLESATLPLEAEILASYESVKTFV